MMCDMCTVLVGHPVFLADMLFMVFWTLIVVHTPSVQFFYQLWLHPKAFASTERALSECDLGPLLISQMKFFATIALATRSSISDNDRHPESGFSCHLNYHSVYHLNILHRQSLKYSIDIYVIIFLDAIHETGVIYNLCYLQMSLSCLRNNVSFICNK